MTVCEFSTDGFCVSCGVFCDDAKSIRLCPFKSGGDNHQASRGAGAELSALLARFGVNPTPTCDCRAKAAEMDAWGCDECSKPERIEEVVDVMREEAKARGLPFLDAVGRVLVRRAISNARRKEAARAKASAQAEGPATAG